MTTPTELPKYQERVAIEESIAVGWAVTKKRFLKLALYLFVVPVIAALPVMVGAAAHEILERNILFGLLLALATFVLTIVCYLGVIKTTIVLKRGQDYTFDDFLSVGNGLLSFLGAGILRGIICFFGFCLFIIPGVIFAIRLEYTDYFIVDKQMGPIQAISSSWKATSGCVGMLTVFAGIMQLLMFVGFCAFGLGTIPAFMVMMVARAQVYDRLVDTCPALTAVALQPGTSIETDAMSVPTPANESTENPLVVDTSNDASAVIESPRALIEIPPASVQKVEDAAVALEQPEQTPQVTDYKFGIDSSIRE